MKKKDIDYNNIWYSFYKASEDERKKFLLDVLKQKNIKFNTANIKNTFTNWQHSNYTFIFTIDNDLKNFAYDVEKDTISEYIA